MSQGYCRSFSILYTYWSFENILGNSKRATKKSVDNAAPVKTEKTEIHKSLSFYEDVSCKSHPLPRTFKGPIGPPTCE